MNTSSTHSQNHAGGTLGFSQIKGLLRHRHPMIYLDRVTDYIPSESLTAQVCISGNMDAIAGHFPDRAIFPGTHLAQSFSQAGIILYLLSSRPLEENEMTLVGSLHSRFSSPVVPGDTVELDLQVRRLVRDETMLFGARAFVRGKTVAFFRGSLSRVAVEDMGEQWW